MTDVDTEEGSSATVTERNSVSHPGLWALGMTTVIVGIAALTGLAITGAFVSSVPVTLTSDRAGLVMETGGKVKFRGVQVGTVGAVTGSGRSASLRLDLDPATVGAIPANVEAEISASTVFGAKYVNLVDPRQAESRHIGADAVIHARNVSTEVNTVFENLVTVLGQVDPPKVNAVLTAVADALRGKGQRLGQATVDAAEVLEALNARTDTLRVDVQSLGAASATYSAAAQDILRALSSFSTTSATISQQSHDLDAALLSTTGLAQSGADLLEPVAANMIRGINDLRPTTALLREYSPEYTCTLQGAYWQVSQDPTFAASGGNGYSAVVDLGLVGLANDQYRYPDNLPIIGAKGGPDGKPGCNGLPRPDLNMPIRALITNTGFGTGMDWRPNPGIAHPWFESWLPVTRSIPGPPTILGKGPPAIGPVPYPGAPPYGAPLFGPDGAPLWAAPPPGVGPPPVPGILNPPPPYGTGTEPTGPPAETPVSAGQP